MPRKKQTIPTLTLHKGSGQGRVRIEGKDFYLGKFGTAACQQRYAELIGEHASGKVVEELPRHRESIRAGKGLLVSELVAAFTAQRINKRYAKNPTEKKNQLDILKEFRVAVGTIPVSEVTGVTIQEVRRLMVNRGLKRQTVNKRTAGIKRMFRWGLANELVTDGVAAKVAAVEALREGDEDVAENGQVHPVAKSDVDATLPFLNRQIKAIVKLQSLTAARGGEILAMRPGDIDRTHEIWWYVPESHKNSHRGHDRSIPLGRQAQEVIQPFLDRESDAFLFSPREAEQERLAALRAARKTRVQPSQQDRGGKSRLRDHYDSNSYRQAITRAVEKCNEKRAEKDLGPVPNWHPHQLRHAAATAIRKSHGVETASLMLGHSSVSMTELYAEKNRELAQKVAAEIG